LTERNRLSLRTIREDLANLLVDSHNTAVVKRERSSLLGLGDTLEVDTSDLLVRVEVEPVAAELDLSVDFGLEAWEGFDGSGWGLLI
jgi:hypothetical protein